MKTIIYQVIFILCLFVQNDGISQGYYHTGFEYNCDDFLNGCVPQWENVSGTADITDFLPQFNCQPYEGERLVQGFANKSNGIDAPGNGETYALNYIFDPCMKYELEYAYRYFGELEGKVDFILVKDLPVTSGPLNQVPEIDESVMQIVDTRYFNSTTDWTEYTVEFRPEDDYQRLWIRLEMLDGEVSDRINHALDDLSIDEMDLNAPEIVLKNEDNDEVKTFCYGEDISVCFRNGYNWGNTKFTIKKYDPSLPFVPTFLATEISLINRCYSLVDIMQSQSSLTFEPGRYSLEISVEYPGCQWVDTEMSFQITCCDIDPGFYYVTLGQNNDILRAQADTDYLSLGGEQEFCLSSDEDFDGVYEEVQCWEGIEFEYTIEECVPYQITHFVSTICGDTSSVQELMIGEDCDREEECSILFFNCVRLFGNTGINFTWGATEDVESFDFEIIVNDPDCGCVGAQNTLNENTTEEAIELPSGICFSIRIRPVCESDIKGDWENKICSTDCLDEFAGDDPVDTRSFDIDKFGFTFYPNPVSDHMVILNSGSVEMAATFEVNDLTGKLILSGDLSSVETFVNTSELKSGMYLIVFKSGDIVLDVQKMIKN